MHTSLKGPIASVGWFDPTVPMVTPITHSLVTERHTCGLVSSCDQKRPVFFFFLNRTNIAAFHTSTVDLKCHRRILSSSSSFMLPFNTASLWSRHGCGLAGLTGAPPCCPHVSPPLSFLFHEKPVPTFHARGHRFNSSQPSSHWTEMNCRNVQWIQQNPQQIFPFRFLCFDSFGMKPACLFNQVWEPSSGSYWVFSTI